MAALHASQVVLKRHAGRFRPPGRETAVQSRFLRDVAQLGQRTCFGIIPELALCYPASSQLASDHKWPNKVRSYTRLEATQILPGQFSIVSAFKPLQRSITALYQQQRNTTSHHHPSPP
jgi:hypothetical protein